MQTLYANFLLLPTLETLVFPKIDLSSKTISTDKAVPGRYLKAVLRKSANSVIVTLIYNGDTSVPCCNSQSIFHTYLQEMNQ